MGALMSKKEVITGPKEENDIIDVKPLLLLRE